MSFADEITLAWATNKRPGWLEKLMHTVRQFLKTRVTSAMKPRDFRIEEKLSIGPKKSLLVVYCRGERFLVASGAENISAVLPLSSSRPRRDARRPVRRTR